MCFPNQRGFRNSKDQNFNSLLCLWQVSIWSVLSKKLWINWSFNLSLRLWFFPQLGKTTSWCFFRFSIGKMRIIPWTFRSGNTWWYNPLARNLSSQHLLPNSTFKVGPGTTRNHCSFMATFKEPNKNWLRSQIKSEGNESEKSSYSYNNLSSLTSPLGRWYELLMVHPYLDPKVLSCTRCPTSNSQKLRVFHVKIRKKAGVPMDFGLTLGVSQHNRIFGCFLIKWLPASNTFDPDPVLNTRQYLLPILLLQQDLLQSEFKANSILFPLHLHLKRPPTASQVYGKMRQLHQTRSATMILKGKDVDWRIDIGYTGWSQQIPSFQGFELIVVETSQRFYWLTVIVERITVDLGGSEGHHGTMGSTAIKWSLFWGGIHKDYRIDFIKILRTHDFQ